MSAFEGVAGTTGFTFTVTLSAASGRPVSVDFAAADGTATIADGDYQAAGGTVTLAAGQTTGTFTVLVNGDNVNEPDEEFLVNLSNADGATIADGQGEGAIVNDDALILSIDDVTATEGDSGTIAVTFTVTMSSVSTSTVTVNYGTADGTAAGADADFQSGSDTIAFAPGETSKTFTVLANGDTKNEADETFFVNLLRAPAAPYRRRPARAPSSTTTPCPTSRSRPVHRGGRLRLPPSPSTFTCPPPAARR